jgi:hypothetical protein
MSTALVESIQSLPERIAGIPTETPRPNGPLSLDEEGERARAAWDVSSAVRKTNWRAFLMVPIESQECFWSQHAMRP